MPATNLKYCVFLLSLCLSAQAVDLKRLVGLESQELCHRHLLNSSGNEPFYIVLERHLDTAESRVALRAAQARLQAEIELVASSPVAPAPVAASGFSFWNPWTWMGSAPAQPAAVAVDETRELRNDLTLIDDLFRLEERIHELKKRLASETRLPTLNHEVSLDAYTVEWLELETAYVIFFLGQAWKTIPDRLQLSRAEERVRELTTSLASLEVSHPTDAKSAPTLPVFVEFIRAGADSKDAEWQKAGARWAPDLSPDLLRQLLPISLLTGQTPSQLAMRYRVLDKLTWQVVFPETEISAEAMLMLVRASLRADRPSIAEVRERLKGMRAIFEEIPGYAFPGPVVLAAAVDLSFELGLEPQQFQKGLARLVVSLKSPISMALLLQLFWEQQRRALPVASLLRQFEDLRAVEGRDGLTSAILAGPALTLGASRVCKEFEWLQVYMGDRAPLYSDPQWARLYVLGRSLNLTAQQTAELARRIFQATGKMLESGRLMTVMALVVMRKFKGPIPADFKVDDFSEEEILEFASLPYLRAMLPIEDLSI